MSKPSKPSKPVVNPSKPVVKPTREKESQFAFGLFSSVNSRSFSGILLQKKSREDFISRLSELDIRIQDYEKQYDGLNDKECHKYEDENIVSPEEIKKAEEDEIKEQLKANERGENYVRPPFLCDIFAKIEEQEKNIIVNRDRARENIIIRKSNDRNARYRREIKKEIEILQYKSDECQRYITDSAACIIYIEKMMRYCYYARTHSLDVNFNNIFRLCNQHRLIKICEQLFKNGHKGTASQCYGPCNKVMIMTDARHAKCECGSAVWHRSEVPSSDFDITSDTAEGKCFGGANFNPTLS